MDPDSAIQTDPPPLRRRRTYVPVVVLVSSLALTAVAAVEVSRSASAEQRLRHQAELDSAAAVVRDRIAQRCETYIAILQGTAGLVSDRYVTLPEFRAYVNGLMLEQTCPGAQGIGIALKARPDDLEKVEQHIASVGQPGYRVEPKEPRRETYFPIVYLEPQDERNRVALGFDMFSEPTRRAAMERARDTGLAAASGKVELKQEASDAAAGRGPVQAGFLIYYPVYSSTLEGLPETVEQRRERIHAFAYCPFRADDFLAGVFRGRDVEWSFALYDGTEIRPEHLLSRGPGAVAAGAATAPAQGGVAARPLTLTVAGRTWTLVFPPQPPPAGGGVSRTAVAVVAAGGAISLLLFSLTRSQSKARYAAERATDDVRRSVAALRRSEEQFRLVTDALPVLVAYVDRDHRYRFNNRAFDHTLGRPRSELPGMHLRDALGEQRYQRILPYVERALAGEQVNFDLEHPGPDGTSRFDSVVYVPHRGPDGTVLGFVALAGDITERKLGERERLRLLAAEQEARAEAERANRSKDEFLATLSHELRTPLNAILGWAQLLRMGALPPDEADQGLETIERNAKAQAQLVEDLLDLSRIISGKIRIEVRPVNLLSVVEGALDSVRPAAEAKGITVVPVLDAHVGVVSGDGHRLQQVAWNLLSNAIKFTPRGGRVDVWLCTSGEDVELTVSDTGAGIKPDFLPHVFDRLRQADASTTRRHGGLGLGLAIVRHLVELHGGTVAARSGGEGKGATFTVRLPLSHRRHAPGGSAAPVPPEAPAAAQRPAAGAPRPLEGLRVLVVDDEADAREVFQIGLQQAGAAVTVAASVAEAMLAFDAAPPDVLLSDIGMPGEDGYGLIRRVRQLGDAGGGAVPAVALTAFARADDRSRAVGAGFDLHVSKPVEPSKLAGLVAELVERKRVHDAAGAAGH